MKIKICGIKRKQDIEYVNLYKPDYIGFVFAKSSRQVTFQQARELKKILAKDICTVGVFVDAEIDFIVSLINDEIIDMVQLHGHENQQYINTLKQRINKPIIKAIKVTNESSFNSSYDVDYYLLDGAVAGSGHCFDWKMIKPFNKPVFLAGGICLDNIDQALQQNVYALDISSGVETNGVKDRQKIGEIVRRTRHVRQIW